MTKPKEEMTKPKEEITKPKEEMNKPKEEMPKPEDDTPKPEDQMPKPKDEMPKPEDEMPRAEDKMPRAEGKMPRAEDKMPRAEDKMTGTDDRSFMKQLRRSYLNTAVSLTFERWMKNSLLDCARRFNVVFLDSHLYDPVVTDALLMILKYRRDIAQGHFQFILPYVTDEHHFGIYYSNVLEIEQPETKRWTAMDFLGFLSWVVFTGFVLRVRDNDLEYLDIVRAYGAKELQEFSNLGCDEDDDVVQILVETARSLNVDTVESYFSSTRLSRRGLCWHLRRRRIAFKRYLSLLCAFFKCYHKSCSPTVRRRKLRFGKFRCAVAKNLLLVI